MAQVTQAVAVIGQVLDLYKKIDGMFTKEKKDHPCPCCRVPKKHHTKCTTLGCRLFKDFLKHHQRELYGSLAFDAGSDKTYHRYRVVGETLVEALHRLPEDKLEEYRKILESVHK